MTTTRHDVELMTVCVERVIDCPFSLVVDESQRLFPLSPCGSSFVRMRLRDIGLPVAGIFTHDVVVSMERRPDETELGRPHAELAFEWSAPSWWLPDFHAVLRFRAEWTQTRLSMIGRYDPPFGPLGAAFDAFIGRRLARATVLDLLGRLAGALESRWQELKYTADFGMQASATAFDSIQPAV